MHGQTIRWQRAEITHFFTEKAKCLLFYYDNLFKSAFLYLHKQLFYTYQFGELFEFVYPEGRVQKKSLLQTLLLLL